MIGDARLDPPPAVACAAHQPAGPLPPAGDRMTRRWNPIAAAVVFGAASWLVIAAIVAVWWWVA